MTYLRFTPGHLEVVPVSLFHQKTSWTNRKRFPVRIHHFQSLLGGVLRHGEANGASHASENLLEMTRSHRYGHGCEIIGVNQKSLLAASGRPSKVQSQHLH